MTYSQSDMKTLRVVRVVYEERLRSLVPIVSETNEDVPQTRQQLESSVSQFGIEYTLAGKLLDVQSHHGGCYLQATARPVSERREFQLVERTLGHKLLARLDCLIESLVKCAVWEFRCRRELDTQ